MSGFQRRLDGISRIMKKWHASPAGFGIFTLVSKVCVVAVLLALSPATFALDVEEIIWGFDGQVVPYRFNMLSILVSNPTDEPIDVRLRLTRASNAGAGRVGANLDEAVFLSPFSSRWVQFNPYVTSRWDEWNVAWGRGPDRSFDIPRPRMGSLARIALTDPAGLRAGNASVKALPDNLFPPMVTATENLEAVFLDHAPRWQQLRRQAMLDWLFRGGKLYLTRGADGAFPTFTGQLAVLNAPLDKQHIGSGSVVRLDMQLRDVDQDLVVKLLGEPSTVNRASTDDWDLASSLFGRLNRMTTPDHNWFVIHTMSIVYLGLIFPGWYYLSRQRTDYRSTILAFLGIAIVFTIAFNIVGRRGYGETTTVNSVAVARPVGGGFYDVLQWSNVFVTDGDAYLLKHAGTGHLYSTCQNFERVNGVIDNGVEGTFLVDIPLFSSRSFVHRAKMLANPLEFTVEKFEAQQKLDELVLLPSGRLPERATHIAALYRDMLYSLVHRDGKLVRGESAFPLRDTAQFNNRDDEYNYRWKAYNRAVSADTFYQDMRGPLMARALRLSRQQDVSDFQLPDDRVCVFFYAPMTDQFQIQHDGLGVQRGQVLYAFDVLRPESEADE